MEAKAILERLERDPTFRIFALDMYKPGQGPNDLIVYLQDKDGMNHEAWVDFVKGLEVPLSSHEDYQPDADRIRKTAKMADGHGDVHA